MRTVKRHTPALLDRFRTDGRGIGVHGDYIPWHRVSRGDPSSHGRSHLINWSGRLRELLSDVEWVTLAFAIMVPEIFDLREQFPLALDDDLHELAAYDISQRYRNYPGSRDLAQSLGIRHPCVHAKGESVSWVMTTDQLLTLKHPDGRLELLAVACKTAQGLEGRRTREKLQLERAYWQARGVEWLLITPDQYDESVGLTLRREIPWALEELTSKAQRHIAATLASTLVGHSLTYVLVRIAECLGSMELAQRAFWQAVWRAELPLELRRGWRPHLPVTLLEMDDYFRLNPIISRRSAWSS
ncbi:MAG TPA: TnsA endonuclease N-terminal domain-containing protein [Thiomonas arsenitoxydans]|jgi:hypothetical protein|uniref:TnsA endonuclease N-terminal domain-containing protein n=1 Tax=Thiomonas arsenitoxydans (strain DSM 22701 / CIP 110005 / 3As) TaxID=426114 RepID=UPI002D138750|nr:TnsA endonuclease N-terminal domain-containing protein [Thiomonas arsenitoxydans]HML83428.1 TnsA endonuclease N-terminal domain-containing protein [Thiomonas arsenitoxydans]